MSLAVRNLSKVYGQQVAVNNISFEARSGEILGFLGPNGAGKSTTMKIANGFVPPTQGSVKVCDLDVVDDSVAVRRHIGYLPEHNPLYVEMYVHEYLRFIGSMYGLRGAKLKDRVGEMVELCGLTLEQNKIIGTLSKGFRQRIGLAQALIHDPQVLILDEPTTGLDPNQLTEIRNLIKNISSQKTVIFSTHIMQEVQALCDRVVIINRGNLVIDSPLKDLKPRDQQKAHTPHQIVEVEFSSPVPTVKLEAIEGIAQTEKISGNVYKVHAQPDKDIREVIFRFACQENIPLLEMTAQKSFASKKNTHGSTLEEIFRSLTLN